MIPGAIIRAVAEVMRDGEGIDYSRAFRDLTDEVLIDEIADRALALKARGYGS